MAIMRTAILAFVGTVMAQTSEAGGETSGSSIDAVSTTTSILSSSVTAASTWTSYADISSLPATSTEALSGMTSSSEADNMGSSSYYYQSEPSTAVVSSSESLSSLIETSTPSGSIVSEASSVTSKEPGGSTGGMSTPYANVTNPTVTATNSPISGDGIVKDVPASLLLAVIVLTAVLQM